MKTYLFLLFIFLPLLLFSQYSPIECKGEIPKDFLIPSHIKYKEAKKEIDRNIKGRTKRNQKDFFLNSNFHIDDLLRSGYVLFNDPISKYTEEIAGILLKDNPELLKELRFYTTRSTAVNAFATNQGIIFINVGLIANLDNEAQLAFILAHEIAHYQEKHALELFLESKNIDRKNRKTLLKNEKFTTSLEKNQFSREQESEADQLGLNLFLQSDYNTKEIDKVFTKLQNANLPFKELFFNKSYFENDYINFPPEYQLDTILMVRSNTVTDDTTSTHPSIPKRRLAAEEVITKNATKGNKNFIISEQRYKNIQQRAQYELLEYHLSNYQFYNAIYNAFLLQASNSDDLYLKEVIAKSLYGMCKFRNNGSIYSFKLDHENVPGELGRLVYFFNQLSDAELNTMTLRYTYLLKDDFKDNIIFQQMVEDLCQSLVNHHNSKVSFLIEGKPLKIKKRNTEYNLSSVFDSPAKDSLKKETLKKDSLDFHLPKAFDDLKKQDAFMTMIDKCRTKKPKKKAGILSWGIEETSTLNNGDFALGEKRVLMINPFYLNLKKGFTKPLLIKTEKSQTSFNKIIQECSNLLDLKLILLDGNNLEKSDVEKFNDLRVISEWIGHHLETSERFEMIAFNQEQVNKIAKKYNVDTITLMGMISGKTDKTLFEIGGMLIFNQLHWITNVLMPKGESLIISFSSDLNTGQLRMSTFDLIKFTDGQSIKKQRVYDILGQIRRSPKN